MKVGKMEERIGIIGAGRLGSSLARAFCEAGCQVIAISDRIDSVAKVCAAQCDENTRAYSIDDLPTDLSVLILSVPDDEIGNVVERLSLTLKISENTIIAHTSGALVSDVLYPLRETTRNLASMHPIQTFSGSTDDWKLLFGLSYGLEGNRDSLRRLEILLKKLKGKIFIIPKNKKALYHLSCVFASNIMLGVEAASIKIMEHIGFSESESFQLLEPLISATIENIKKGWPSKSVDRAGGAWRFRNGISTSGRVGKFISRFITCVRCTFAIFGKSVHHAKESRSTKSKRHK